MVNHYCTVALFVNMSLGGTVSRLCVVSCVVGIRLRGEFILQFSKVFTCSEGCFVWGSHRG
jgi:hypothetical protein